MLVHEEEERKNGEIAHKFQAIYQLSALDEERWQDESGIFFSSLHHDDDDDDDYCVENRRAHFSRSIDF